MRDLNTFKQRRNRRDHRNAAVNGRVVSTAPEVRDDILMVPDIFDIRFFDVTPQTNSFSYNGIPTEDTDINLDGYDRATINIAGSTSFNINVNLPEYPLARKFGETAFYAGAIRISYNKGTHAGTFQIGGISVTGSGTICFAWDVSGGWKHTATEDVVLQCPNGSDSASFSFEDILVPGSGKTFEVKVPTAKVDDIYIVQYRLNSTLFDGTVIIGGVSCDGNASGNGEVLFFQWNPDTRSYEFTNEIDLPDGINAVTIGAGIFTVWNKGAQLSEVTFNLPVNESYARGRFINVTVSFQNEGDPIDVKVNAGALGGIVELDMSSGSDVVVSPMFWTDPENGWLPFGNIYSKVGHTHT